MLAKHKAYLLYRNILTFRTRAGSTIVNTFDELNRLKTKTPQSEPTVTYVYDLAGRLLSASKPVVSGDPGTGTFSLDYDSAGRFYLEEYPDSKTVEHVLDENGNATRTTYPDGSWYIDRVFDELNRLTDIKLNGTTSSALEFQYDALSRRTKTVYENGCVTDFDFEIDNDLNSLVQTFVGSSVEFTLGYDNINRITSQLVSDSQFMWHPATGGTVSYGSANNLNQYPTVGAASYTYNNNGCLTSNGIWTYGYSVEDNLTSATKTGLTASFSYDSRMRQVQKQVGSVKTIYYYSGLQRLADYDGSGTLQDRYVYGAGLDDVLIKVSSGGTKTYYHKNWQGSIVALTNSSGAVTNRYQYSPFGESGSMSGTTHGFTGQRWDDETGLYFYKNRHYAPSIGRFLEPDPIGFGDGLNTYAYVGNDPLNMIDPLGLAGTPSPGGSSGSGGLPFDPTQRDKKWVDPTKPGPNGEPPREGASPDPLVDSILIQPFVGLGKGILGVFARRAFWAEEAGASFPSSWWNAIKDSATQAEKNGFTKAGRAWQKHSNRPGGHYSPKSNDPTEANKLGKEMVDYIINHDEAIIVPKGTDYEIWAPFGQGWLRGIRVDAEGNFGTFLTPTVTPW